jgi:hypothetical protein
MSDIEREKIAKMGYTHPASSDNQAHWSQGNPGLADQYRQEAFAAREALGFSCDSLEVSPADIRQAIADKQAVSVPVYAIGRGGYIQHDTNTGQLEIYETEALARVNARDGDIVRAVNVNQV